MHTEKGTNKCKLTKIFFSLSEICPRGNYIAAKTSETYYQFQQFIDYLMVVLLLLSSSAVLVKSAYSLSIVTPLLLLLPFGSSHDSSYFNHNHGWVNFRDGGLSKDYWDVKPGSFQLGISTCISCQHDTIGGGEICMHTNGGSGVRHWSKSTGAHCRRMTIVWKSSQLLWRWVN